MKKPCTKTDDFCFAVELGLMKAGVPARRSKNETREERERRRERIARQIADHIKRSNWKVERGPVARTHTTTGKTGEDDGLTRYPLQPNRGDRH